MYGLVTISVAALIASTTCCGAPIGGMAIPFTIFPLGAGWNCGSVGDTPPEVLDGGGGVVEVCPSGSGQERAAGQNHYCERKRCFSALRQGLFRTPAGLADGLALKELARFASLLEVKLAPKPGSPAPLTRVRRGGHSTPSSRGKPSLLLGPFLPPYDSGADELCTGCGGERSAGPGRADRTRP